MRVFDYADMRKIPRLYGVEYPDYRMTYQDILCFSFSKKILRVVLEKVQSKVMQ